MEIKIVIYEDCSWKEPFHSNCLTITNIHNKEFSLHHFFKLTQERFKTFLNSMLNVLFFRNLFFLSTGTEWNNLQKE